MSGSASGAYLEMNLTVHDAAEGTRLGLESTVQGSDSRGARLRLESTVQTGGVDSSVLVLPIHRCTCLARAQRLTSF
jgi:hypothetical protein